MTMYNYICFWGAFGCIAILLALIVIRLGDIKDILTLIDFTQDKIHKYVFMIYMAERSKLKQHGIDLNQLCEDYCKKMTEEIDNGFDPSEEDFDAMSEMMNESYVDHDSADDFDK